MIKKILVIVAVVFCISVSSAYAENHCGSWKSGKLTNWTRAVKTSGDTRNNGVIEVKVGFLKTASTDYGVCDADKFHRYWRWKKIFGATRVINKAVGWDVIPDPSRT